LSRALAIVALIAAIAAPVIAQAPPPITVPLRYKNSTYDLTYNPANKQLICVSDNAGCKWTATVANSIKSTPDFAGQATPAGPIVIYNEGNNVKYTLLHFRTGKNSVPNSGEPLNGTISSGQLQSATFTVQDYGAKVTVVVINGDKRETFKWDINMYGTSKPTTAPVSEPANLRTTSTSAGLSFIPPRGFSFTNAADATKFFGPVPRVSMILLGAEADVSLADFTDMLMAEFAKGMQMKETSREPISIAENMPGLIVMADGKIEGVDAEFGVLVFEQGASKYVAVYGAATDLFDTYLQSFIELLNSIEMP